jgi:hypothetical protein
MELLRPESGHSAVYMGCVLSVADWLFAPKWFRFKWRYEICPKQNGR